MCAYIHKPKSTYSSRQYYRQYINKHQQIKRTLCCIRASGTGLLLEGGGRSAMARMDGRSARNRYRKAAEERRNPAGCARTPQMLAIRFVFLKHKKA